MQRIENVENLRQVRENAKETIQKKQMQDFDLRGYRLSGRRIRTDL